MADAKIKKLKLIPLIDLDALRKLPPVEIIFKTHFVTQGLNIVFGPSGAYKSFYALGLSLQIAQSQAVAYVAAEGSSGLSARVDAWLGYNKLSSANIHFTCEEVNLLDEDSVTNLIYTYKKTTPSITFVVIDTYARCLIGGDENSAKDAGLAVRNCAKIQRELKSSVTLIHHTNKAESSERGSGALRGAADSMVEISATDQNIRVECSKMKDREVWPTEYYRFMPYGESGLLLPADEVPTSTTLSKNHVKILEFLRLSVFDTCGARTQSIVQGVNLPASTVYRLLAELKTNSHVMQSKKGDPYFISGLGEIELEGQLSKSGKAASASKGDGLEIEVEELSVTIN